MSANPPIGAVVWWHKNLTSMSIPSGWLECNGQIVSDSASPLNGQTLPNLNGNQRYLKGGSSSGSDSGGNLNHTHTVSFYLKNSGPSYSSSGKERNLDEPEHYYMDYHSHWAPSQTSTSGTASVPNTVMVAIIRVK